MNPEKTNATAGRKNPDRAAKTKTANEKAKDLEGKDKLDQPIDNGNQLDGKGDQGINNDQPNQDGTDTDANANAKELEPSSSSANATGPDGKLVNRTSPKRHNDDLLMPDASDGDDGKEKKQRPAGTTPNRLKNDVIDIDEEKPDLAPGSSQRIGLYQPGGGSHLPR